MNRLAAALAAGVFAVTLATASARADNPTPYTGTQVVETGQPFLDFEKRLTSAIRSNGMGIVATASATAGAKKIGVDIAENRVIMIFHPRFAVRMLDASVAAGIEAPLRLYLSQNADGTARLTYRLPTAVFGPYAVQALDDMAAELDVIVAAIVADATGG